MTHSRIVRAQVWLGTLVIIQLDTDQTMGTDSFFEKAFGVFETIHRCMSAHDADSDLARLSVAQAHDVVEVHPWTYEVLQLAQFWFRLSGGAFDPCKAAVKLHPNRPGLSLQNAGSMNDLHFLPDHTIEVLQPVMIDLGGIAKGYAVDRAVDALSALGVISGLVEAGGDLRAWGHRRWPCEVRHARHDLRDRAITTRYPLQQGAMATSASAGVNDEFIQTKRGLKTTWRSATVFAPDCVSADALTKWALQSTRLCPTLTQTLRQFKAHMWRSI
jgi:FAD:protein FMN transferase